MSFSKDIDKYVNRTSDKMDRVVRMSFIELSTRVIRRSPVGDASFWKGSKPKGYTGGRFRANWQASVNSPKTGTKKTTRASSSSKSLTSTAKRKTRKGFYLVNNLPYATRLEQGHSRQARDGIIRLATAEWKSIVRLVRGLVK